MASPILLNVFISLAMQAAQMPTYLEDKTRYDEPETQSPYGKDPHGPDPHGRDAHDEVHDKDLPANNPQKYFKNNGKN